MFPAYKLNGKSFKTILGLMKHIAKSTGAVEVAGVSSDGVMRAYGADNNVVGQFRFAHKPDAIEVTQIAA